MSDYGDFCREQRARQQAHRLRQAGDAFRFIEEMIGLGFSQAPCGNGLRFTGRKNYETGAPGLRIDFWPSTGKWNVVGTPDYPKGGRQMVKYAKAFTTAEGKVETANQPAPKAPRVWKPTGPGNPPWEK